MRTIRTAMMVVWEFPPGPGGIGQHAFGAATALRHAGYETFIVTSGDYAEPDQIKTFDKENNDLDITRIYGLGLSKPFRRLLAAIRIARSKRPDFLLLSGRAGLWFALPLRLFLGNEAVIVAFLHGSEVKPRKGWVRALNQLSLRYVTFVVCVSSFTRSLLPESVLRRMDVRVVPNGLSLRLMPNTNLPALPSIQNEGAPRLLTVGRISPRKGQHRVVKALPFLSRIWPNIHYHIVGMDDARSHILELASDLGVSKHVTVHGVFKDRNMLYQAFCSADVFIMLSENQENGDVEGFGIAILEANYFGLPAIGAKGSGIEDAINSGINGYLVEADDPHSISTAIGKCLSQNSLRDGARRWAKRHDWDELIMRIVGQL